MRIHRNIEHSFKWMTITEISLMAVLSTTLVFAEGNQTGGDTESTTPNRAMTNTTTPAQHGTTFPFKHFVSPDGGYTFEGPEAWEQPLDSLDPTRLASFVGPINRVQATVVFLIVRRYTQDGVIMSIENEIAQLHHDRTRRFITDRIIHIGQHPARVMTVQEQATVLLQTLEIVEFNLTESYVLIQESNSTYVLEYAASPDLFEVYWPIFDRLVMSFHTQSDILQQEKNR